MIIDQGILACCTGTGEIADQDKKVEEPKVAVKQESKQKIATRLGLIVKLLGLLDNNSNNLT